MDMFCGIDWSEDHHDVALVDATGQMLAQRRIPHSAAGFVELLDLLAAHGDTAQAQVPVAIETPRGLLVSGLRATGRPVYAINPLSVSRYRDRRTVSRGKSDPGDALILAHLLRTDRAAHRPLPEDSEQARAVAVLARAQQDAVWDKINTHNRLRSLLLEYYPALVEAFTTKRGGIMRPEARALLAAAPTPAAGAALTRPQLVRILRSAGRRRLLHAHAEDLHTALRSDQLRQPAAVEQAMGRHALALVALLETACRNAAALAVAGEEAFNAHPDAAVIGSFPGVGTLTGARLLAEIGDDHRRFADPRGLKAYAGSAPITRASGRSRSVTTRRIKNQRLAAAGYAWAFSALTASPGARRHYDRRRAAGDSHTAAQRHLLNRLLGCLHHCLTTSKPYREDIAFPTGEHADQPAAA